MPRTPSTSPTQRVLAASLFVWAGIVLLLPVGLAVTELRHLAGFGWPGPYDSSIAEAQAEESLWKVQAVAVLAALVLVGTTIGAGFAARAAGQRVWLVCVSGVVATVVALGLGGVLLTL